MKHKATVRLKPEIAQAVYQLAHDTGKSACYIASAAIHRGLQTPRMQAHLNALIGLQKMRADQDKAVREIAKQVPKL